MSTEIDWDNGDITQPPGTSQPSSSQPDWDSGQISPPAQPPKRSIGAALNDTVIEVANAAAGGVSSAANFVKPGNAASKWIDENIVKAGEAKQSDVVKAEKQRLSADMSAAEGVGDEVAAVGRYIVNNPVLAAAQAAGSFVGPGLAVKGATTAARAAGAAAKTVERAGRAGGVAAGAAMAGGDAAGTAYELASKAGATEDQSVAAGRQASVIPAIVGGVGGAFGAEKLLAGAKGFTGGTVARALKTGASEAAQEGIEEGVTQYEGQRAAMPYDAAIDPSKGVAGAAAMGAALGGITGAGMGALDSLRQRAPTPSPDPAEPLAAPGDQPPEAPAMALPAPVIDIAADGTARTAEDRNARLSRIASGDVTDVTPIPSNPVRDQVATAAAQGGALSSAALTAIDTGAAAAVQPAEPEAALPAPISLEEADARDQAAYEQFFASADSSPVVGRYFENDDDIPDFDAASNVSDEEFLRALGATDEDIQDAIATTRQPASPQGSAAVNAGAQANEPTGTGQGAGATAADQEGEVAAPTNLREGLEKIRAQKQQEAANAQAATPQAAPATTTVSAARPGAVEADGVDRSKLLGSLDQTGATREMVLDAKLKDAQYRLSQLTSTTGILPADRASRLSGINQEIADLTDVRAQARELDKRDRREGNTRFMLQGARQELDAAVGAGAITPEAAQAIASNAKNTGNAADASEAIFAAVDSSTTGATSEPQADQAVEASPQPAQAGAAPAASAAPGQAGPATPAGTSTVRALNDGAQVENAGAQAAPAAGAQGEAQGGAVEALRQQLRDVEARIVQAAPAALGQGGGDIEAAMKSRKVPVTLKAQRKKLEEQVRAAQATEVRAFAPETGTLGIPRADMPQVPAQSHGGLVKHLNAQGIEHETTMVDAAGLKPTQAEFSPSKVEKAKEATGDRAVIVSSDGHIIDGHHQAMAAAEDGKPVKAIVLDAPVEQALEAVKNSPSAQAQPTEPAAQAKPAQAVNPRVPPENRTLEIRSASEKEPWQMTALEFSQQEKGNPHWNQSYEGKDDGAYLADTAATHRRLVQEAIAAAPQKVADDFIPAPDGGLDYGEITPEMGKAMRRQAGKIRLQQGDASFGLQHIELRHGDEIRKAGFESIEAFVSGAVADIESIWKPEATSQLVVIQATERGKVVFIQLQAGKDDDGDFYTVKTAFPSSRTYAEKRKEWKQLWSRVPVPAADTGKSAPSAELGNEAGSKSTMESGQSDAVSVPPTPETPQPITRADVTAAKQQAAAIITERIDAMTAGEVNTIARRFLPTMGVRPAVSKERNKAAVVDFTKVNPLAAADEFGATLPADVRRALQADMEGAVADGFVEQGTTKPTVAATSGAPIEDFGQKIGGARKDVWSGFKDDLNKVMDDDIAGQPLAKVWPAPDYQKLIDAGMDAKSVAAVRALRDEVPAKPRASWKVKRWAEQVKTLRSLANDVMDGKITVADMERMGANKGTSLRGMMGRIELYELVGHAKSLDGVRFAQHHYTLYRGRENVDLWVVEKDADASAFSNWPREIAIGDTKEQALAAFREKYDSLDLQNAVRKAAFDIFSERGSNAFFVGKKIGRNYAKLEGPFKTVKEAREYREKNLAALGAKLEKYKEIPRERADVNQPRVGVDMRNGQDVTPQMFGEVFGFRGVEFGNWVEQKRRQKDLNDAFDALMDMAAVLDIPPKAISLNGELGLAFGARGGGGVNPAAAHYEPDMVVINLTKKEGAGSLGHEWWHALDNYFSKQRKTNRGSFMTTSTDVGLAARGKDYFYEGGVRREMIDAFGAVVKAINQTAMKARAAKLDGKRSKEYWTTGEEMAARAFESYLISKLQDQDASNDYLANVVSEKTWDAMAALGMENENSYPYPTAAEIPAIRAGFDHFFQTVETREDDAGNVAMFSSADSTPPAKPLSLNRVNQLVQEALSGIRGAPPVEVTARPADVGLQVPAGSVGYGVTLRSGDIYVFQSAMGSDLDVFKTVFHELFHRGVRVLVPKGQYVQTMLDLAKGDSRIQQLAIEWKNTEMGQKQKENLREQGYTGAELTGQYEALAIEEALAAVAEEIKAEGRLGSKPKNMTIRFLANWLAKLADLAGMKKLAAGIRAMTYNEAERFIMSAIDRSGEPVQAGRTDNLRSEDATAGLDIRYRSADLRSLKASAIDQIHQTLSHPGKVSLWDRTVGTMRHLAERNPAFKPVFEAAQQFIDDVAMMANDAAEMAPRLLPRVETWRDLRKSPISAQDNKAVARPLFDGTLLWGRDVGGKPVLVRDLESKYANLSADDKAQMMLKAGRIDPGVLKMWRGLPLDQYETAINTRFTNTLLKAGVVWTDQELKDLFQSTPEQASLYREARKAIDRSIDMTSRADMLRLLGEPYAPMRDVVLEAPTLTDAMTLLVESLEQDAKENPDDRDRLAGLMHGLRQRQEKAAELMAQGYAPLSRFGRYTVDVVDAAGERQYFGMFETAREANQMALRMRSTFQGAKVTQGTMSQEAYKLFAGITPESLEMFGNMLGLDSEGSDAQDKAFQEYLRLTKNNHSALKRLIHRQGIAGFSEDVGRVLASFVYSNARQAAGALNAGTVERAIGNIPKEQGELKDVAMGLQSYIRDPQEEGQAIRGMLFAQYLGGSVASAFVNMTQPFQITLPWLSQYGGMKSAGAQLARAVKDMARRGHKYEADLAQALKHAEDDGVVSPQEIHQLMAQARGSGSLRAGDGTRVGDMRAKAGNQWEKTKVLWGQPFALAEQFNRRSTFIAAYRLAKEQGKANPAEFARRAVLETQFLYCVDEQTECLTTDGWKSRADLSVGDVVIGVDADGRATETPLMAIHSFPGRQPVVEFSNANRFSMVVTDGHRHVVQNYNSRDKVWQKPLFRTTTELRDGHHLMRVPVSEVERSNGDADFAALLGWVAAEGTYAKFRNCKSKRNVRLVQSSSHNPEYVDEIEALLQRLGGHYRRFETPNDLTLFTLKKPLSTRVLEAMPEKLLTWAMVASMGVNEMRATLDAFSKGDGHKLKDGGWSIGQKQEQNLHVLQAMAVLCGQNATMYPSTNRDAGKVAHLYLHTQGKRTMVKQLTRATGEVQDGVWCPETGTGTWIARRNGAVFVTGNSKANKPRWARGAIGGTVFTFKTYSVSYLELMHRMWTQGGPEGKRAVGWAVAMLLLMGGAGGLPFMEDAEDLIDGAGQLMGYNVSSKQWRMALLRDVLGKELASFVEQGVSGLPGAPVDVSGRLGMGNLIPGTGLFLDKPNRTRDMAELVGPAGDLISRGFTGARKALTGDLAGAALEVSPVAVRNAAKGVDMATSGIYKDTKGYKVIDTTLDEALSKAIGFQPKSVAQVQEAAGFMQRSRSFYVKTSSEIKAQWAQALFNKDEAALEDVRERLAAWNRNNPEQPIVVKMPDVWKRVREMGKDRNQRIADTAPKALREQMRNMARENG